MEDCSNVGGLLVVHMSSRSPLHFTLNGLVPISSSTRMSHPNE